MDLFRDENQRARGVLAKVPAGGGAVQRFRTAGAPNPTEPDWSPDGKWIAFTSQTGEFDICVVPADGSAPPTVLVRGQRPVVVAEFADADFQPAHRLPDTCCLCLTCSRNNTRILRRISGSDSQPAWAKDLNF